MNWETYQKLTDKEIAYYNEHLKVKYSFKDYYYMVFGVLGILFLYVFILLIGAVGLEGGLLNEAFYMISEVFQRMVNLFAIFFIISFIYDAGYLIIRLIVYKKWIKKVTNKRSAMNLEGDYL